MDLKVVDQNSIISLANWLSKIVESHVGSEEEGGCKSLELEISFGRIAYQVPNQLFFTTLPHVYQQQDMKGIDVGACLETSWPWHHIVPPDWKCAGDHLAKASLENLLTHFLPSLDKMLVLGGGDKTHACCAISSWNTFRHVNFDPIVTEKDVQNAIAHKHSDRTRFEKVRISHVDTSKPEFLWCQKDASNHFAKDYIVSQEFDQTCKLVLKKAPAVVPFVSSRSLSQSSPTASDVTPWAAGSSIGIKKRKIAAPSVLRSNFMTLLDFAIYANLEEKVDIVADPAYSTDPCYKLLQQTIPNSGIHDKNPSTLVVNAFTHLAPTPVVNCRKSFYFASPSKSENPPVLVWRLDVSLCWRPTASQMSAISSNDLYNSAIYCRDALEMRDYDGLKKKMAKLAEQCILPDVEIELECINVLALLVACEGDYKKFATHFCMMALFVQKMLGNLARPPKDTLSLTTVPCSLPKSIFCLFANQ